MSWTILSSPDRAVMNAFDDTIRRKSGPKTLRATLDAPVEINGEIRPDLPTLDRDALARIRHFVEVNALQFSQRDISETSITIRVG